jgi:hypothetical protein
MGISFVLCFLADLAITFAIGFSDPGPFIGAGDKLLVFITPLFPLAANGAAIYWAATTHRERCLKGVILCTSLMVLLDCACFGLMT